MASKKTSAKTALAKTTEPANTSAPTAGANAEVSAAGAGQPAPNAETTGAPSAPPTATTSETPPNGGTGADPSVIVTKISEAQDARTLVVSAKAEGFRRAGRAWSKNAETVSAADFTPAQIEALRAEPMLDVTIVADKAE